MSLRIAVIDGRPDPEMARFGHTVAETYAIRARAGSHGPLTPMLPGEALSWHRCFIDSGSMRR